MPALSARAQGYLYALAAPLCWSVGGVVIRVVETGPWEIVFWRAAAHMVAYPFVLVLLLNVRPMRSLRDTGWPAAISAAMVCGTFVLHVIGMTSTTVANALLLQSTSPLIVALLAHFFLKDRVPAASWVAIAVAFAGLALVMGASLDEGAMLGKFAALAVALAGAINVTTIRATRGRFDLRAATIPAAAAACAFGFAFGDPSATSWQDAGLLIGLGLVQMTIGMTFFYAALRRLAPVEVMLIALIEPVLGPVWTWIAVGEVPSQGTMVGGAVLLAALAFNTLATARKVQAP